MDSMRYKIIVADDEYHIREGLMSFQWDALGFCAAGSASNGKKALELMEAVQADVLVTDIKMPVMDGLELCRNIHSRYPNCKVVILTGYKDFEYARTALVSGAIDYLLKPVNLNKLEELFKDIKISLDEERKASGLLDTYRRQLSETLPAAARNLFLSILEGKMTDIEEISEKMDLLEISMRHSYFACSILEPAHIDSSKVSTNLSSQIPESFFEDFGNICDASLYAIMEETQIILLWNFDLPQHCSSARDYMMNSINKLCSQLKDKFEIQLSMGVIAGIGDVYKNILSFPKSFQEACKSLEDKFFNEDENIFYIWKNSLYLMEVTPEYPYDIEDKLVSAIFSDTQEAWSEHLSNFWLELGKSQGYSSPSHIKNSVIQLLNGLDRKASRLGTSMELLLGIKPPFIDFVNNPGTLAGLKQEVFSVLLMLTDAMPKASPDVKTSCHLAVQASKKYIMEHFNEKLSLSQVAEQVYLNPSYFSIQFKKETGRNFVDFLAEYRIERAKELLSRYDLKVYEVGLRVGYENHKYFTDTFKKYTGLTPKEYRNQYLSDK